MAADRFPTTRLSLILAASGGNDSQSRDAMAALYRMYWLPLQAFVRRLGYDADQAQDLVQGFVARLMEKNALGDFERGRGRFRSFLLGALKNFLANERDFARAQKRGGGLAAVPLEAALDALDNLTPDKVFEKQWALDVVNRVLGRLRHESVQAGKNEQFDRLSGFLSGHDDSVRYRHVAGQLGMTEGAVKVAVHRLRLRFHETLREEVSLTVADEREISDEIRFLIEAVRN